MIVAARLHQAKRRVSGFTLVELMVATVITLILLGFLSVMCSEALHIWRNGSNRLAANSDIRIAMDILSTDLQSAMLNEGGFETLHALPMANIGAANFQASNPTCVMFFSTPLDLNTALSGNINAISYQLAYQDDLQAGGSNSVLALYRTVVDSPTTYASVLGLSDIYNGYWKAQQAGGNTTNVNNFLIPNVVDFKMTFWYKDSQGNLNRIDPTVSEIRLGPTLQVTPAPTGFDANSKLVLVDVSVTVLTREGALLLKSQALPMAALARRYSYTYVRRIQLNPF